MKFNSYLNFKGNCKEAITFYGTVFGVEPKILTFGELPDDPNFPMTDDMKKLVMHGNLEICGNELMFSDVLPNMEFICGNNISISIKGDDKEKLSEWFHKLAEGGEIVMPLEESSWSELYGFLTDKFGIGWQINYTK